MTTQDPTTDYEQALALFSKMPKPKPFTLIDPAKDFRNAPKWKPGMVSSIVDIQKPPATAKTKNPLLDIINDQQMQTEDEVARQQRRVAAQGMVNGLSNVVKSLFSAYGANKGAPIHPVKDTSPQDNARSDQLWNQQMSLQQRNNAEKLQVMLEDVRHQRTNDEYWQRYNQQQEDEERKDIRNWGQQKQAILLSADNQRTQNAAYEQRQAILENLRHQNDLKEIEARKKADEEIYNRYGKFAPKAASTTKPKEEQTYFSVGDINLTEGQYNEDLTALEALQAQNSEPVLSKKGKSTGELKYKDERFKGLENIDMSTKLGQDKAIRTYHKILAEYLKQDSPGTGQPAGGKIKELSFQDFGSRLEKTMSDPVFMKSDKGGHVKQLTGIALKYKAYVPELRNLSDSKIQEIMQAYYDQYYPKK
jgi:hypothetical protein